MALLPPDQLLHLGPDPSPTVGWNHFDLGQGLATHINYSQAKLSLSPPQGAPWWYSKLNADGIPVVQFSAPLGGATTSTNTAYARDELREYERDGITKMAFDPKDGDHWIEGIYRVTGLGVDKRGVCVQQMHDPGDDTIMVRTENNGSGTGLYLNYNGTRVATLNASFVIGQEFYLKTRVNNGTPSVYYTTNLASIPSTPTHTAAGYFSGASVGWYSKSGCYNQSNELTDPTLDPDASIIKVEVRELKHWHSKTPMGGAWPTPASYTTTPTGPTAPTVNAGADASILPSGTFARTGTVTLNGSTLTSQQWRILSGPSGAGTVLSTTAAVNWTPSAGNTTSGGAGTQTVGVGGVATPAPASNVELNTSNRGSMNITASGTALVPRIYDGGGFGCGRIDINADYIVIQNYRINAGSQYGAYINGNNITFQNNDIKNVIGGGDVSAIAAFGNNHKIRYNTAVNFISGTQTLGVGGVSTPPGAILATSDQTGVQLNITTSGTAANPRVYDGQGHTIGKIEIRANYVVVQNYRVRPRANLGISIGYGDAKVNHVTVQNNDIKDVMLSGDGDLNAMEMWGDDITIAYNTAIDFITGDAGASHTDFIQTWNTHAGWNTTNVRIIGNRATGEPDDALNNINTHINQAVIGEGFDSGSGGGGGSGVSSNWFVADNYWTADCKFDGIDDVTFTRNSFAANDKRVVVVGSTSSNFKYYSDNKIVDGGSVSVGIGASVIPGSGPVTPVLSAGSFSGDSNFIQTWVDAAHPVASSNWEIIGNKATGPSNPSRLTTISSLHQCVTGEGLNRGGNSGGSGDPHDWLIADNEFGDSWTQCIKLDGVDNVDITRNTFVGSSNKILDVSVASSNVKYWSDNIVTGSYSGGVGFGTTSGSGPASPSGGGGTTVIAYPNGTYVLAFEAVTSTGTIADTVDVIITTTPSGGGGGTPIYPSFVGASAVGSSDGSATITVGPPAGVAVGHLQLCVIQNTTTVTITDVPAGWFLLDSNAVANVDTGQPGGPSSMSVYYNTTGDAQTRSWGKNDSRGGFHAIRMAWKDYSGLGQHLVRGSSFTTTPYALTVVPTIDTALVITILGSDRNDIGPGPVSVPTGWSARYNAGITVNTNEIEWVSLADIQVTNRVATGGNLPSGTGVDTSNFTLTNADDCSMFSLVLEGPLVSGTTTPSAISLNAQGNLFVDVLGQRAAVSLIEDVTLSVRPTSLGTVTLPIVASLLLDARVYPRGTFIITATLTFVSKANFLGALQLTILGVLRAGALPYRRPVLRTDYKYPPPNHPFRLIAQRILDGEIVDWDLPVDTDFEYQVQLSGPIIMQGAFKPELIQVQELALDGYAYWLHVEVNQEIRASAIMLPPKYDESSMTFTAEGVAAVPHYQYYDSTFSQITVDAFSVIRTLWNYVQAQPQSDYGVVVTQDNSGQTLGFAEWDELIFDPATQEFHTDHHDAEPYELFWWDAVNIGEEIDKLSGQVPFDFLEHHKWNSTKTDVDHSISLGYPRLGQPRPNLVFDEENIIEVVPVQESENNYASAVLVIGGGEGEDSIRSYVSHSYGDRVRKVVVITDKTINKRDRADALAQSELTSRIGGRFEIAEVVIDAYHPHAPIGTYDVGDDIQVRVQIPWLMETQVAWYRITSITFKPSSDKIRLGLSLSSTFVNTSEIIPDPLNNYVPPAPIPPGPLTYAQYVTLTIDASLTVGSTLIPVLVGGVFLTSTAVLLPGGIALRTGSVSMTVGKTLTAAGIATVASSSTVTLSVTATLTSSTALISSGAVALSMSVTLTSNGAVPPRLGFGSTTFGSLPFGSDALNSSVLLTVTAGLTANATHTRFGAVSLVSNKTVTVGFFNVLVGAVGMTATKSLVVGATVGGITTSQLGKQTDGTGVSSSTGDKTVVSQYTATASGVVTAGHSRLFVDTGTAATEMVVYADNAGAVGGLLGQSNTVTISNTTEAQINFTFAGAQQAAITSGADYWIGFTWPDPGTNNISWSRDTTVGGSQQNNFHAPDPFGTPTALAGPIDAFVDITSGAGGGPVTPVIRSSSTGGKSANADPSITSNKPAGLVVGDYLLAFYGGDGDSVLSDLTASGFTLLSSQSPNSATSQPAGKIFGKVATSGDVSATDFTFGASTTGDAAVILTAIQTGTYSTTTPVTVLGSWTIQGRTSNMQQTAPSITGVIKGLLMDVFITDTNGTTETYPTSGPAGMTRLATRQGVPSGPYVMVGAYYEALASTGATGTNSVSPTPSGITINSWITTALIVNPG